MERLKHIFKKYSIDAAGLQEVCMNWAQLPLSLTLAQMIQRTVENIRSVASYNKREDKEAGAGKVQWGGTATILREELTAYVTNSGVTVVVVLAGRRRRISNQSGHGIRTMQQCSK